MKNLPALFLTLSIILIITAFPKEAYAWSGTGWYQNLLSRGMYTPTSLNNTLNRYKNYRMVRNVPSISTPTPIATTKPSPISIPTPTTTPLATIKPTPITTPITTPLPTIKPNPTPIVTPTLKPVPTTTPIPTAAPTLIPIPTPTTTPNNENDTVKSYIMNAINEYRRSQGLYEVKTDPYTCGFAKTRASEISSNFSHDGFNQRVNAGTLPYPGYSSITENIAMTSDYQRVVQLWINSAGHAENMRRDTPYVCVERYGNYYAYEGWKPLR
jgi:uncharacterized protein YkwD